MAQGFREARRGRRGNRACWGVPRLPVLPAGSTVCASGRTLRYSLGSYPQCPPVVITRKGDDAQPRRGRLPRRCQDRGRPSGQGVIAGVRRCHRDAPARSSAGRAPVEQKNGQRPHPPWLWGGLGGEGAATHTNGTPRKKGLGFRTAPPVSDVTREPCRASWSTWGSRPMIDTLRGGTRDGE
jgi:hypothetical protein